MIAVVLVAPGVLGTAARVRGVTLTTPALGSQAIVALRNSGTVLLTGTGALTVTGRGRRTVAMPFTLDTVLPAATDRVMIPLPTLRLQPGAYAVGVRVRSSAGASLIAWQGQAVVARPAVPAPLPNVTLPPVQALAHTAQRTPLVWLLGGAALLLLVVGLVVGAGVALGHQAGRRRAAQGGQGAASSAPVATTRTPMRCARLMVAATIVASPLSVVMCVTNPRSIVRSSTGNRFR